MTGTKPVSPEEYINDFYAYLNNKEFSCIAAKAALAKQQVHCMVAGHMACPKDDISILKFLYEFVDVYRNSGELYHTAAVIFTAPEMFTEQMFDSLLWNRLQALSDADAMHYAYDNRVDANPASPNFSFSLKQEAFFIIGLHPNSSRQTRRFKHAAIVFNPHAQFEQLRQTAKYENMKGAIRKRDIATSGSVNPMLQDYGDASEVYQYSGRRYNDQWQCPLNIKHATT